MMNILVLNVGSSSLKATLYRLGDGQPPPHPEAAPWEAKVQWGRHPGKAEMRVRGTAADEREIEFHSARAVVRPVVETIWLGRTAVLGGPGEIAAAGHRVVHGGKEFREPAAVTPAVKAAIERYCEFAPVHNRFELDAIEAIEEILGAELPQFAVFDTAFHATLPPEATTYPVPFDWSKQGIVRYGFHGTSHRYVARRAADILGRPLPELRIVTCHLGNGASLAAVRGGLSVDTTMGTTPLEGIMMGTRSGSIDPGILIHLMRNRGYGADRIEDVLNRESGLKGVSGVSGDWREILDAMDRGNQRAKLAFDMYVYRLCQGIGAMTASLGGLDALVFTAGIGENSPRLRAAACERLTFLGIGLNADKNARTPGDEDIADAESRVRVLVIRTEEDWEIARECHRLLLR